MKLCIICGKILNEKKIKKWGITWCKKTGRGKFCSRQCYYEFRKGKRFSKNTEFNNKTTWNNHPRFINGRWSYHQFIKNSCGICGKKNNLMVHHKDKDNKNNKLNNLMTVCAKCHTIIHPRKFYGNQYVEA